MAATTIAATHSRATRCGGAADIATHRTSPLEGAVVDEPMGYGAAGAGVSNDAVRTADGAAGVFSTRIARVGR